MATLFPGKETPGLDRVAGHFMDGSVIKYVMVSNRQATVYDQYGNAQHTCPVQLPEGFVPKSLGCIRSAQTGKLIVVAGGFNMGTSGQLAHVLATDYVIAPPATYQG